MKKIKDYWVNSKELKSFLNNQGDKEDFLPTTSYKKIVGFTVKVRITISEIK